LEKEEIKTIEKHRENRIDAQYYLKVQGEKEIENMLRESKFFVAEFEELVTNLSEREISEFREKMKNI